MAKRALFDSLRSIPFGDISASYAPIGMPTTILPRTICVTNLTQGHMILSLDDTDPDGNMICPAGSYKLYDVTANIVPEQDDGFFIGKQTTVYVKQVTAPVSGSVYIEYIYGI